MHVTCICMEGTEGYPDPMIYSVIDGTLLSPEEIRKDVLEQRVEELGEYWREYLEKNFRVCFAFKDDLSYEDIIFDDRI